MNLSEHLGHIPPSSIHTFLRNYPDMTGLVVTDHSNTSYVNKFFNSMYDNVENLNYEYLNSTAEIPKDSIQQHIINVSQILARSLYEEITNQEAPIPKDLNTALVNIKSDNKT